MAIKGRRIGFVDFHLDNFHANVYLGAFRKELKDRGFEVTGCTALQETEGRAWAAKNGVPYFAGAKAMGRAQRARGGATLCLRREPPRPSIGVDRLPGLRLRGHGASRFQIGAERDHRGQVLPVRH